MSKGIKHLQTLSFVELPALSAFSMDITSDSSIGTVSQKLMSEFGGVNNAGVSGSELIMRGDLAVLDIHVFDTTPYVADKKPWDAW